MGRALKIGLAALLMIAVLIGLATAGLSQKDPPETFLEDDPTIRADPDYPVKISDVSELADQVVIQRDVWIPTRDGTRLSANIFKPAAPGKYPVVMAFTAYDKNKGPDTYPKLLRHSLKANFDLGTLNVSPWTSWEGPDPAFWVPNGYAVAYVDSRGFASSEGDPSTLSQRDRDDFYDAIEWAGAQDWSNGNVGLNGVSYLAISQWVAASGNPPSLKAIVPWEGQSDPFREVIYHGGIPEVNFTNFWVRKMRSGANGNPLPHPVLFEFAQQRPGLLRWFQTRPNTVTGIDLPNIEVPALIAATWSDHGLHTRGSFEGYKRIASEQKWLYTHGRGKWDVYYSDEALAFQKDFFDHFLKGEDNGFDERASVRLEVRETLTEYAVRVEDSWPLPQTEYRQLFLDPGTNALLIEPPRAAATASYDSNSGRAQFDRVFDQDTELTGNMKLRLWVSAPDANDMDLFVGVHKLDTAGEEVTFFGKTGYTKGPAAMGWLRVSQRALDNARSTLWQPVLTHGEPQPLSAGEIVPVEIEILPSSTLFRAGETLRLIIQGRDLFDHPSLGHGFPVNHGVHQLYAGGQYDSHLLVPEIPKQPD